MALQLRRSALDFEFLSREVKGLGRGLGAVNEPRRLGRTGSRAPRGSAKQGSAAGVLGRFRLETALGELALAEALQDFAFSTLRWLLDVGVDLEGGVGDWTGFRLGGKELIDQHTGHTGRLQHSMQSEAFLSGDSLLCGFQLHCHVYPSLDTAACTGFSDLWQSLTGFH